ncbi:MAG TPA: ferritin-like domain-containing protein [Phycisphaerales bacterium]
MLDNLKSLLEDQIRDLYSAENQLTKALPKMAKKATSETLKDAFTSHLDETVGHIQRLEKIAQMLEVKPSGKVCKAMKGLVEEGKEAIDESGEDAVIDAALIGAAQRVEHYEIAAYGCARALAEQLGETKIIQLLQETLDEESAANEKLTGISLDEVLPAAVQQESSEQEQAPPRSRSKKSGN